jgi:hypothetical protein
MLPFGNDSVNNLQRASTGNAQDGGQEETRGNPGYFSVMQGAGSQPVGKACQCDPAVMQHAALLLNK